MSPKNFVDSHSTSGKPPPDRVILRRERDRTRLILVYCITGFILVFGQTAISAEICATSIAEMKTVPSESLRKIAEQMENSKGFTNKVNRSHIKFNSPDGPNGRMLVSFFSTHDKDGSFEFIEGALTVCDEDGKITINSLPTGKRELSFADSCFRVSGGLAIFVSNDRTTFCTGDMPTSVQLAMEEKARNDRALSGNSEVANTVSDVLNRTGAAPTRVVR